MKPYTLNLAGQKGLVPITRTGFPKVGIKGQFLTTTNSKFAAYHGALGSDEQTNYPFTIAL